MQGREMQSPVRQVQDVILKICHATSVRIASSYRICKNSPSRSDSRYQDTQPVSIVFLHESKACTAVGKTDLIVWKDVLTIFVC